MFSSTPQGKRKKGGKHSSWNKKLKAAWWKNPRCHWCETITNLHNRFIYEGLQRDNAATLDHLYSNLDIRRLVKGGDETVIACYKCNNGRAAKENRQVFQNLYDTRNNYISIFDLLIDYNLKS